MLTAVPAVPPFRHAGGTIAASGLLLALCAASTGAQGGPPGGSPPVGTSPVIGTASGMQRADIATRASMRRPSSSRLVKYTVVGAGSGAALAMGYWAMSEKGMRGSNCKPLECALPFLSISGAVAGLFLAHELEAQRIATSPREGAIARFSTTEAALPAPPTWVEVNDSLVVVATDSGVQVISTAGTKPVISARRAAGLRAIRQVAMVPGREVLTIGTASALWETPYLAGPARRIGDGAVSALAASDRAVLSAQGALLQLQRGVDENTSITDTLRLNGAVGAVAWDAREEQWLAATDSSLTRVQVGARGLQATSSTPIPSGARGMAIGANYIAIVLGDAGIVAFSREMLQRAQEGGVVSPMRMVGEPRFAFDAAFAGDTLYVAGGVDGLFRMELSPQPRLLNSSRQFPFVTLVRNQNGTIWVGDRGKESMVRIDR